MATKIYTKIGDQGQSALFGGEKVSKSDRRLEAYGTIDELNAVLGLVQSELGPAPSPLLNLIPVQNYLFTLGSHLACGEESMRAHLPQLSSDKVQDIESRIDQMEAQLRALKNFILPGGSKASALFHLARTVCRRAERRVVDAQSLHPVNSLILIYLNRLGDYLFVAARYCNQQENIEDVIWQKNS